MLTPLSICFSISDIILFNDSSIPLWPLFLLYKVKTDAALKFECSMYLILSRSSFEIIGLLIVKFIACFSDKSNKLHPLPIDKLVSVIISSLIPSSGGFVT